MLWGLVFFPGLIAAKTLPGKVIIIVSMNIKPFAEALDGINDILASTKGIEQEIIFLDRYQPPEIEAIFSEFKKLENGSFIAIGPEAMVALWANCNEPKCYKIFSMVLNPEKLLPEEKNLRGVSLNLPPEIQIQKFYELFPKVKQLGLLFNPEHNLSFYLSTESIARQLGVQIIPLQVRSPSELRGVLDKGWNAIQGLWFIPDQTIISESIISYITKEALSRGIAVFGYNRFFFDSGAAMSFILDYRQIGRHTAQLLLAGGEADSPAQILPPDYTVKINYKIINKIGISLTSGFAEPQGIQEVENRSP